jgi:hypothetical protein
MWYWNVIGNAVRTYPIWHNGGRSYTSCTMYILRATVAQLKRNQLFRSFVSFDMAAVHIWLYSIVVQSGAGQIGSPDIAIIWKPGLSKVINRILFLIKSYLNSDMNPSSVCYCSWIFKIKIFFKSPITYNYYTCRYSDGLPAERPRGRSLSPGKGKDFLFSTSSRPVLGPTQPPIQWVTGGSFLGSKAAGAWSWPLTSNQCRGEECVKLYIHSPISLHGAVLN